MRHSERQAHPLAAVLPQLRDTLGEIADEATHSMIVTDAQGHVLWGTGPSDTRHSWTSAAAPIHDVETGAVVGAVDVTGLARPFHPTTLALVVAAARLAEGLLGAQVAMRDERLLARNLPHLDELRDEPFALLSPTGRVLAAQPPGWLPPRIDLPAAGELVALAEGREGTLEPLADGWLLRLRRPAHQAVVGSADTRSSSPR